MDLPRIAINIVSLVIALVMLYYAVRLIFLFRRGLLEKPWKYIAAGVISITTANIVIMTRNVIAGDPTGNLLTYLGLLANLMGAIFLATGLMTEFRIWHNFKEKEEEPGTTVEKEAQKSVINK